MSAVKPKFWGAPWLRALAVTHEPSQGSAVLGKDGDFPVLVAGAAQCPAAGSGTAVQPLGPAAEG